MAVIKLFLFAFSGACLVFGASGQTCTEDEVNACFTTANDVYEMQKYTPFYLSDEDIPKYCSAVTSLTTCLEQHRAACWPQFYRLVTYAAPEQIGRYICANTEEYKRHRDEMTSGLTQLAWGNCNVEVGMGAYNGLELVNEQPVCDNLLKYDACWRKYAEESAKDYIQQMAKAIMGNTFDLYYHCNRAKVCPASSVSVEEGACSVYNPAIKTYGFPILLNIPLNELDGYCGGFKYYDACLSNYIEPCKSNFGLSNDFRAYHGMGYVICKNQDDYRRYQSDIANPTVRSKWLECTTESGIVDLNGNEQGMCSKLDTFLGCYKNVTTDTEAQELMGMVAGGALTFYQEHYGCISAACISTPTVLQMFVTLAAFWLVKMLN